MRVPLVEPDWDDDLTAPYWEGFQEEEVRLPICRDCDQYHWYPKTICPHCQSSNLGWTAVSGRMTVYTWVGVNYDFRLPFLKDQVPLHTGLVVPHEANHARIPALLDFGEDDPEIGCEVVPTYHESKDGTKAPVYSPSEMSE